MDNGAACLPTSADGANLIFVVKCEIYKRLSGLPVQYLSLQRELDQKRIKQGYLAIRIVSYLALLLENTASFLKMSHTYFASSEFTFKELTNHCYLFPLDCFCQPDLAVKYIYSQGPTILKQDNFGDCSVSCCIPSFPPPSVKFLDYQVCTTLLNCTSLVDYDMVKTKG